MPAASVFSRSFWKTWWPLALFALLWIDLVRMLSPNWAAREEYAYGWFVPFFAVYLFVRRWSDRPTISSGVLERSPSWLVAAIVLTTLVLLPWRIVIEINADWPTITWSYTGLVVILTGYALFRCGGWSWVRHFGFAIAFILLALPWPYGLERSLTQNLMRIVAGITVEVLGLVSVPAMQHGNLIEVGTGMVGVDEACSGIRSFQSTLMAALLMGEMYRLRFVGRIALLGTGLSLAFALNIVRTFILTWQVNRNGMETLKKWHDPAGLTIALACFVALWGIAALTQRRWSQRPPCDLENPRPSFDRPFLLSYLRVVGVWAVIVLMLTEFWYRAHDSTAKNSRWSIRMPKAVPSFKVLEVPPRAVRLLGHDAAVTGGWREPDGSEWTAFFFRWEPRSIQSIFSARIHRPDVCLPGAGFAQITNAGVAHFSAGVLSLPFSRYTFASDNGTIHVFFCQWEDGAEKQSGVASSRKLGRLRTALEGKRRLGQQSLEFIIKGYPTFEMAEEAFRRRLPDFIQNDIVQSAGLP